MITSVEEMITRYVTAWNNSGLEEFKAAFAECWAPEGIYTDPAYALVEGVDGIAGLAQISLQNIPVRTFSVATPPEYHHNVGRYNWKLELPGETKGGFDYFEFNDDYKITRIVSFF